MRALKILVVFFLCVGAGYTYDVFILKGSSGNAGHLGLLSGCMLGVLLAGIHVLCRHIHAKYLLSFLVGLTCALVFTKTIAVFLAIGGVAQGTVDITHIVLFIVSTYAFTLILITSQDEYQFMIPFVKLHADDDAKKDIILDTSVIIDGRIADMCATTFLSGRLIIPRFVLKELQAIADSSDSLKRNRGRRGLEILNRINSNSRLSVKIQEMDFPEINSVDAKLVKLAATTNAKIFTNDYNLAKVAELQNVEILNINELTNALKPVVLPGEAMEVKVIKEGKESDQGVAYLDDGTMIVVENGRRLIGRKIRVVVTSAYQTQAGRMIFARSENAR
jgi:uncharacterized protein YacL